MVLGGDVCPRANIGYEVIYFLACNIALTASAIAVNAANIAPHEVTPKMPRYSSDLGVEAKMNVTITARLITMYSTFNILV